MHYHTIWEVKTDGTGSNKRSGKQHSSIAASLISIIVGVLVLVFPTLLRFIVGIYLLLVGVLGLLTAL